MKTLKNPKVLLSPQQLKYRSLLLHFLEGGKISRKQKKKIQNSFISKDAFGNHRKLKINEIKLLYEDTKSQVTIVDRGYSYEHYLKLLINN